MTTLVWKTNYSNPYESHHMPMRYGIEETFSQALQRERRFYDSMIKGKPQATDSYTVEELEAMGMIGLYKEEK